MNKNATLSDIADLCGVTKSIIIGYKLSRYHPSKEILILLSSKFDMDYLCMEGYTKLIYHFDEFLDKVNIWIKHNEYTREEASNKLGVSRSLFRFWIYLMEVLLVFVHIIKLNEI